MMRWLIFTFVITAFAAKISDQDWIAFLESNNIKFRESSTRDLPNNMIAYPISEEAMRRELFEANLDDINNLSLQHPQATFAPNKFSVMTLEEKRKYLNGFRQTELKTVFPKAKQLDIKNLNITNSIPHSSKRRGNNYGYQNEFDWNAEGYVLSSSDQRGCGGCWAYATASLLESAELIAGRSVNHLSVQQFIDCSTEDDGCEGGYFSRTASYLQTTSKYYLEKDYPSTFATGKCKAPSATPYSIDNISIYVVPQTEDGIMATLVFVGPAYVSFLTPTALFNYNSGILSQSVCADPNVLYSYNAPFSDHAVVITGWGIHSEGNAVTPYWIVKNSWGENWGSGGYFYIRRGDGVCNIDGAEGAYAWSISTKNCGSLSMSQCNGGGCFWCDSKNKCLSVDTPCEACSQSCTGSCKKCGQRCVSSQVDCAEPCECITGDCCDGCHFRANNYVCRASEGICENDVFCLGTSPTCPSDRDYLGSNVICRASADPAKFCDQAETCTGYSPQCPPDITTNEGSVCSTGRCRNGACFDMKCTSDEFCAWSRCSDFICDNGKCLYAFNGSSTNKVCRASRGVCDVEEKCQSGTIWCPSDTFAPVGNPPKGSCASFSDTQCLNSIQCDGSKPWCVASFKDSSVTCREAENGCDVIEKCTGYSAGCPPDLTKEGQACIAENYENALCTSSKECLGEFLGVCGSDLDCNNGKNCTSYFCKDSHCEYSYRSSDNVCRPKRDKCDIEEKCTGNSYLCPIDLTIDGCSTSNFTPEETEDSEDTPFYRKAWFYIVICIAVVAIVIIIVAVGCTGKQKIHVSLDTNSKTDYELD